MSKLSERVPTDPGVKSNGRTAQVHVVVALGFDIISSSLCSRAHVQTAIACDGRGRRYLLPSASFTFVLGKWTLNPSRDHSHSGFSG